MLFKLGPGGVFVCVSQALNLQTNAVVLRVPLFKVFQLTLYHKLSHQPFFP